VIVKRKRRMSLTLAVSLKAMMSDGCDSENPAILAETQLKNKFSVMLALQNLHVNMPRTHAVTSGMVF
jgi:hypothetical protein